jgi:hypothetical protein
MITMLLSLTCIVNEANPNPDIRSAKMIAHGAFNLILMINLTLFHAMWAIIKNRNVTVT